MTVAQLIEWLRTQDQGAIVQVVTIGKSPTYESFGPAKLVDLDVTNSDHVEYTDLRGNQFINADEPHFNHRYLELGSTD